MNIKNPLNIFLSLSLIALIFTPVAHAQFTAGAFCNFMPNDAISGNVTLSSDCVVYEDVNGPAAGNLTLSGNNLTLYRTLVWYPGYSISITNGARIFVNSNSQITQTKLCIKDADGDHIPGTKDLTVNPATGETLSPTPESNLVTQFDIVAASTTDYTCPANYLLRDGGWFTSLSYADINDSTSAYGDRTSDYEFLKLGFHIDGISDTLAATGDIITPGTKDLIVTRSLQVNQGATVSGNLQVGYSAQAISAGDAIFSGDVGIGLTNPGAALEVTGSVNLSKGADRTIQIPQQAADTVGDDLYIHAGQGGTGGFGTLAGGHLYLDGGTATGAQAGYVLIGTVTGSGVGIGVTTPSAVLDINGDIKSLGISNTGTITNTGGIVNLNVSSNFATNINTGTSTGAITVGGGSNTVAVNSSNWDVSTAGAISGVTGFTQSSGNLVLGGAAAASELRILEPSASGTNYTAFKVAAQTDSLTYTLPTTYGTNGFFLQTNGSGTLTWASAISSRDTKNIVGLFETPSDALDQILNTNIYRFHYKSGMGTGDSKTEYVGVMADEAPWAMHHNGTIVNPVNTLGYMVLGVQALDEKINDQQKQIDELKKQIELLKR